MERVTDFIFWVPKSLPMVTVALKLETRTPWKRSHDQPRQHIKKQRHYFANRGLFSQSYGFSKQHHHHHITNTFTIMEKEEENIIRGRKV